MSPIRVRCAKKGFACWKPWFRTKSPLPKTVQVGPNVPGRRETRSGQRPIRGTWRSLWQRPARLAAYVLALLDHGEVINAQIYLDRLAALAPDFVTTVFLQRAWRW